MTKFNREKVLRQLEFKRKWRSYSRYVYIAVPCVLCCLLCLYFAYSKFFVSEEQAVIRTTVGAYIDGEYSSTIPGKNDGYVVENVVCDNGAVGEWNNDSWGLLATNLSKRTKCNVYFKKLVTKVPDIIAQLDTSGKCPTVNDDGSVSVTGVEDTNGYLCKAPDAYGTSYYYRGNVTNNYVKFAGFYWRIIRINGDGTVRVIYDGTSAHANYDRSDDRQIGTSAFNSSSNDNAYVGYMYGKTGASTYAETHANTNNSTIKTYLDTWYENNIKGTTNERYIADNIFCNDRSLASNNTGTGAGTSRTYYRWGNFEYNANNNKIMLTCPQKNDAFTVNDTNKGNGALSYGIGLITTDEAVLASNYRYLYWTMSPSYFDSYPTVGVVDHSRSQPVTESYGVQPVLNLNNKVLSQGSGTSDDPYHIAEN